MKAEREAERREREREGGGERWKRKDREREKKKERSEKRDARREQREAKRSTHRAVERTLTRWVAHSATTTNPPARSASLLALLSPSWPPRSPSPSRASHRNSGHVARRPKSNQLHAQAPQRQQGRKQVAGGFGEERGEMAESQSSLTSGDGTRWTREQDKAFEEALSVYYDDDDDRPGRWEQIAAAVAGKNVAEVRRHYEVLQEDISLIESGRVALPNYSLASLSLSEEAAASDSPGARNGAGFSNGNAAVGGKGVSAKSADQERRKGIPWSEEEHRLFLLGLAKFGKGDWRSISRNFVISRTPTQVASHAQKYFIRLNSINKDKRRSSIHDITNVNNGDAAQQGQGPITGQPGPSSATGQPLQAGMYPGQQMIGQPPAVGAPVMLPPPGYGPRGHLARPVMPGQQMGMAPHMAYPMQQPGMHH